MSVSISRLAYQDVFDVFDRALGDPHGIRIPFPSRGKAFQYRLRMNYARIIDRKDNTKIYEEGDPMYGRSPYDPLTVTIHEIERTWYLYIIPRVDASRLEIESLEGLEEPTETIEEPPRQIEKQPEPLRLTYRR